MISFTVDWHMPSWFILQRLWWFSGHFYIKGLGSVPPGCRGRLWWIEVTLCGLRVSTNAAYE